MTNRIIVPDTVLAYAQQFLAPSEMAMPATRAVSAAIEAMITTATEAGLLRQDGRMSWTPPEPIGDHTRLKGLGIRQNRVVSAYTQSRPARAFAVSASDRGTAGVRISSVWVSVYAQDGSDHLDPVTYGYDEGDGGAVVSWGFSRPARRAAIEVRRPAGSTGPWRARLLQMCRAGEQLDVAGDRLEATALAHGGVPQHNAHGSRITLFEDAEITLHTLEALAPRSGFDGLVALLPPSSTPAAASRAPDSRVRRLSVDRTLSS
jgi:hypothetical protein